MKWNDIREKIKKPIDSVGVEMKKVVTAQSSTVNGSDVRHDSKKTNLIISIAVVVLIIIAGVWFIQSKKKVANVGPVVDAGITREEARAAQNFLQQIPLKPLTPEEIKMINTSTDVVEPSDVPSSTAVNIEKQLPKKSN